MQPKSPGKTILYTLFIFHEHISFFLNPCWDVNDNCFHLSFVSILTTDAVHSSFYWLEKVQIMLTKLLYFLNKCHKWKITIPFYHFFPWTTITVKLIFLHTGKLHCLLKVFSQSLIYTIKKQYINTTTSEYCPICLHTLSSFFTCIVSAHTGSLNVSYTLSQIL